MFGEALPPAQQQLCVKLGRIPVVRTFYLAGGTAAALHLGHRESIDLDFFRAGQFHPDSVGQPLEAKLECRWDQYERNTITGSANGIKLSFFRYPYRLIRPLEAYGRLAVASKLDVACMKLVAIGQRGRRRDFLDLYCLLEDLGLDTWSLWSDARRKFGLAADSIYWLARGLAFFGDADREPGPRMLKRVSWASVRRRFSDDSRRLLARLG